MRLYDTNGWISISQTSCVDRAVTQWELIMFFFFFLLNFGATKLWGNKGQCIPRGFKEKKTTWKWDDSSSVGNIYLLLDTKMYSAICKVPFVT